jgi:hypothetical protein
MRLFFLMLLLSTYMCVHTLLWTVMKPLSFTLASCILDIGCFITFFVNLLLVVTKCLWCMMRDTNLYQYQSYTIFGHLGVALFWFFA